MTTETHLLEMPGHGAPMLDVLNELCNFIDTQSPGAISTVFLLDNEGARLQPVAGPKAPKTWKKEIDNLEAGPYAGFCSTGRRSGKIPDGGRYQQRSAVCGAPGSSVARGLASSSFPPHFVHREANLGALALSYPQREHWPQPNAEMIERAIYLAAIAIECYRNEQELRGVFATAKPVARRRTAPDCPRITRQHGTKSSRCWR